MPYRGPGGGSGIAGIDVQEGGVSAVAAATALNFDSDDFTITDEGSNIAGIALDATLFAGTYLAINGSNRMQPGAEIRTLSGFMDFELSADIADQNDSFADGSLDLSFWNEHISDEANLGESEGAGYYEWIANANITNASQTTGHGALGTRNTYQGDFEVISRLVHFRAGGSSFTDNSFGLAVVNAADWDPDGSWPAVGNRASLSGVVVTGLGAIWAPNITGTAGTNVARGGVSDYWVRIVRTGTTVELFRGTSDGSDTPPGSWTSMQSKAVAGLDDEVVFVLVYFPTGTTGTSGSGSYGRAHQFTVVSADTINADGPIATGWRMDITPNVDANTAIFKARYNAGTTAFEWVVPTADNIQLSLGPDRDMLIMRDTDETAGDTMKIGLPDNASRRLVLCDDGDIETDTTFAAANHPTLTIKNAAFDRDLNIFCNGTEAVIETQVDQNWALDLNRRSGDVRLFSSLDATTPTRILKIFSYDTGGGAQRQLQIYGSSDNFHWIQADASSSGLILRHDGGLIRLLQTGSTAFHTTEIATLASVVTNRVQIGGPSSHRALLNILAKTTATAAPGALNLQDEGGNQTFFVCRSSNVNRIAFYTSDPGAAAGAPTGHLGAILAKTGSDYVLGDLKQNIDQGWRTDAPDDRIFFNAGGALKSIGFGACSAFAAIYNDGTSSGQTVNVGADDKCTQFTTNFGSDRGMTPDVANDEIDVTEDGIYYIAASFDFTCDQNNTTVTFRAKIDGTTDIPMGVMDRKVGTGGDHGSCSFSGFVALTATDTVSIYLTHDNGVSNVLITIDHCQLTLIKVGNA